MIGGNQESSAKVGLAPFDKSTKQEIQSDSVSSHSGPIVFQ